MQTLAMREFQQKGKRALRGKKKEPILLTGRGDISYFLVPVFGKDIELEYRELLRAQALSNLRQSQLQAKKLGLDTLSDAEIDTEIAASRKKRRIQQ